METVVDIIEGVFNKCKNLEIKDIDELGKILFVLGFLLPSQNFFNRVWDPITDDPELGLVDCVSKLWSTSKSDIQRLIKGGGFKVNNIVPSKDVKVKDLPWIELEDGWRFCVIKKGKNQFDFILS